MEKTITNKIEKLRNELHQLYLAKGDLLSKKILKKSQELDKLILLAQKGKNKLSL